jgi:hypothetical protein
MQLQALLVAGLQRTEGKHPHLLTLLLTQGLNRPTYEPSTLRNHLEPAAAVLGMKKPVPLLLAYTSSATASYASLAVEEPASAKCWFTAGRHISTPCLLDSASYTYVIGFLLCYTACVDKDHRSCRLTSGSNGR